MPQADGFASGAAGPPLSRSVSFSKGCCGFSSKTLVSWPVCSLTCVRPASLMRTPELSASRKSRSILPSAAGLPLPLASHGEHSGWPRNTCPSRGSSSRGVLMLQLR